MIYSAFFLPLFLVLPSFSDNFLAIHAILIFERKTRNFTLFLGAFLQCNPRVEAMSLENSGKGRNATRKEIGLIKK